MFKSITDNGYNGFYQVVEFCLEDSTERSESNPGRSLGIITIERSAVWKTVPTHERSISNPINLLSEKYSVVKRTRIIRI